MAAIDGQWDMVSQTPMGEQTSVLTLTGKPDGSFVGVNSGTLGSLDVTDGQVEGETVRFRMELKIPFPMTLNATATLAEDSLDGSISAGAFGDMPFTARRKS